MGRWTRRTWTLALLMLALLAPLHAAAQGFESVLAPGKLAHAHARFEDDCKQCHVRFDRNAQDRLCMDCHKEVGADVKTKSGYHGRLAAQACRTCHTDHKGPNAQLVVLDTAHFNHAATDFVLGGAHASVECAACHRPPARYRQAPLTCVACHKKDDAHKGSFGTQCAECHTDSNWKKPKFDHRRTRFALTGRHANLTCASCHTQADRKNAPLACIGCHRQDDASKGHRGKFGEQCDTCHDAFSWKKHRFDHNAIDVFPLRGLHRLVACVTCHTGDLYKDKLGTTCYTCHQKDDPHAGSLGERCDDCHRESGWNARQTRVDHDRTRFKLRNAHAAPKVSCASCHQDLRSFRNTPLDCHSCHKKDDVHKGQQGKACGQCHDDRSWKKAKIDHARTRFPLLGRHLAVGCAACHKTPRFADAPRDCDACHAKDDRHRRRLSTDCAACHTPRAWALSKFNHDVETRYPLQGLHRSVACEQCHRQPAPSGQLAAPLADTRCVACHAKDDTHDGALGTRCEQCHSTAGWRRASPRAPS